MSKLFRTYFLLGMFLTSSSFAASCCEEPLVQQPQQGETVRPKLFFSSDDDIPDPLSDLPDPRQDYGWPSNNQSSFYESLTR